MSENKSSGFRNGLIAGVVATGLVGTAVFEYWVYGSDQIASLQPQTGGMELAETAATTPAGGETPQPTPTPNSIDVGDIGVAFDALRLYDEPDPAALVLNEYPTTTQFVVVEPGSQFAIYPVTNGGENWVRVRSDEGLIGWAMIDTLAF